ncbi:MAG: thiamine-phosphate kinase [Planctomycetota bacterium]|nr:thiamine-phosphate kinase [Planctomycetota bacterium]
MSFNEDQIHQLFAASFTPNHELVGPGDDCAILVTSDGRICVSVDQLIAGIHFDDSASVQQIATKLIGRSLSDIAAVGGHPLACMLTCGFPEDYSDEQSAALSIAIIAAAKNQGLPIIGGDCTTTQQLALSCTVFGKAIHPVPGRKNASASNLIFVSRALGGALSSGRHLEPRPEIELGKHLVAHYSPTAMMDLSDGLDNDLGRILKASGVGARIDIDKIPLNANCDWQQAVADGEDYGLLFTIRSSDASELRSDIFFDAQPVFCVGEIVVGNDIVYHSAGRQVQLSLSPFSY